MNRIESCLNQARQDGRKALVAYIVNGDPVPEATLTTMHAMVETGVDIIELGVPFSDPMAEGPVIALGHERALANKTSLKSTMAVVKEFRQTNNHTPVVLMGYANPVERMGYQTFAQNAGDAGVDGLLTVDLPAEEAGPLNQELKKVGIENIFLLAPTTTPERADTIMGVASGFLYYVSLKGVTGAGHLDVTSVEEKLAAWRGRTELPICVGFGIKDADTAKAIARTADGAVVGSVLVDAMGKAADQSAEDIAKAVCDLLQPIRAGLDELKD
ncbi:tryptophan synthase subunit alpha [Pseudomaricurvus alkylphenolicus]|jgi:tryptophan synthase alpha chain|uniref:tryptophan synthase subunit alpha n=1 Tax=Pseudomaricurvus alkylphenolicus TaxID=1306991 RepID=UPI0014241323|nr:tryptophan synthase subunit alpha [Pseudomaricurvus alkylphenolicus]NIB41329.1 tryptophan synthase subunit alpha [Pseudomaricurvus alkylphenolicus]